MDLLADDLGTSYALPEAHPTFQVYSLFLIQEIKDWRLGNYKNLVSGSSETYHLEKTRGQDEDSHSSQ